MDVKITTAASMMVKQVSKWSWALGILTALGATSIWVGRTWWVEASAPPKLLPLTQANRTDETAVQITIPSGTATQQIGQILEAAGLIRSNVAWDLWARWLLWQNPKGGGFKAGTYQLSPTQPLSAIAEEIWKGEVVERSFTIPEGWSLRQMAEYFEAQGFFSATDFMSAASQSQRQQYEWLPADLPSLEGFLYPDTYKLSGDRVTPQAVVQQMLSQFEQVALPLYQQNRNQTRLNLLQWVTLASIVEKEAVVAQERARIAGVFSSRLRRGQRLESDPTVEYGLGIRQTVDQPLTLAQVNTPSAYNTYRNSGLPPAPIASPGLASLKATLYPEPTPYLYFVARYDGTHVFSRTLSEHQAAQVAIRRQLTRQKK